MQNRFVLVSALMGGILAGAALAAAAKEARVPEEAGRRARAPLAAQTTFGPGVLDAVATDGSVQVIVTLVDGAVGSARVAPATRRRERRLRIANGTDAVLERLAPGDFEVRRRFRALPGIAGRVGVRGLMRLARDPRVVRIELDEGGAGHMAQAAPLVGIDATQGLGWTGAGITVAVIDSGIDATHPDLAPALVDEQCFCSGGGGCCPGGGATQSGSGAAADDHGHGTHVAGIVASRGSVAPLGAAPAAALVAVKVLDQNNSFCCSSDVIAALDWILDERPDVDLVNLSLGTTALYPGACDAATPTTSLFATAIDALRDEGVVTVAAALNAGSTVAMSAPACVERAISVGAVWDADVGAQSAFGCIDATTSADRVTCWSNRNDTTDLFAPGAPTVSTALGGGVTSFRGTSQATPLVTGCAALLLESDPSLSPSQLHIALEAAGTLIPDPSVPGEQRRRLDCPAALALAPSLGVPLLPTWGPILCAAALAAVARRSRRAPRGC